MHPKDIELYIENSDIRGLVRKIQGHLSRFEMHNGFRAVAELADVSASAVCEWVNGKRTVPIYKYRSLQLLELLMRCDRPPISSSVVRFNRTDQPFVD